MRAQLVPNICGWMAVNVKGQEIAILQESQRLWRFAEVRERGILSPLTAETGLDSPRGRHLDRSDKG
jgi:hypothetical protein